MGDTITGSAGGNPIYTIQVTAGGQLTFTLIDQIDHTFGDDVETNLPIDLGGVIQVVDEDGDALPAGAGNIVINVGDDIPQIASLRRCRLTRTRWATPTPTPLRSTARSTSAARRPTAST